MKSTKNSPKAIENVPLELMNELYRCYDFFNSHFCKGTLPRPIILITQDHKRKAYGWFSGNCWNHLNQEVSEITLCASAFAKPEEEVFSTLLHEMAHLKNFYENECKVVDCTEQQRHNQIFKTAAEFFGLVVTSSKRFGSGHTTLGANAKAAIKLLKPNTDLFKLAVQLQKKEEKDKKKSNLVPTQVDKETKALIIAAAEKLGISQKQVVSSGVTLLVEMPNRIDTLAAAIFGKKFKTIDDLKAVITANMMPPAPAAEATEEEKPKTKKK